MLKVAGVGAVATEEPYRKRGLMARAAQASLGAMRTNGYDLTILRGRHYARFGYVRAWNYVTYRLKPDEVALWTAPTPYELLGPDKLDELAALYNESHQAFTGTAVRPPYRTDKGGELKAHGWHDGAGRLAGRRVNDELDLLVFEQVDRVGPAFLQFENALHFQAGVLEHVGRAVRRHQFKSQFGKLFGQFGGLRLVRIAHADEHATAEGQRRPRRHLRFGVSNAKIGVEAHHLASRTHFGRQQNVLPVKTVERENRFLDRPILRPDFLREPEFRQLFSGHDLRGELRQWHPDGLADERHGA